MYALFPELQDFVQLQSSWLPGSVWQRGGRHFQDIQGKDPLIPNVYLGISQKAEADASKDVAVEKVVIHPGFQNQSDWDNDLALIKLKHPVIMSNKVTPIPLPERGWGWGIFLTPAASLKHLVLPLANHSDCKAEYERDPLTPAVDENMFCTGATAFQEMFALVTLEVLWLFWTLKPEMRTLLESCPMTNPATAQVQPQEDDFKDVFCLAGVSTLPEIMSCLNNKCPEKWCADSCPST
ncbi:Mannan-binding lectin serine protease 2 [Oryzias melastigma]|uniref:Mannan-binding lectin serine protease 2 n=1 Tax=Oryzias melastigma TaxID=30732 RepID=A0A834BR02_ORYME|nr:Mannan-binding lectin serine protease 2 [Oryzias melastigma]